MKIIRATKEQSKIVASLALKLWPEHTLEKLHQEMQALLRNPEIALFLAWEEERAVGFTQCSLRHDYVEGTESTPVGYLEGIYVEKEFEGRGFARALLSASEKWSLEQGCHEFASDCELTNENSLAFHLATGFTEANRIICFTKKLKHGNKVC